MVQKFAYERHRKPYLHFGRKSYCDDEAKAIFSQMDIVPSAEQLLTAGRYSTRWTATAAAL